MRGKSRPAEGRPESHRDRFARSEYQSEDRKALAFPYLCEPRPWVLQAAGELGEIVEETGFRMTAAGNLTFPCVPWRGMAGIAYNGGSLPIIRGPVRRAI